MGSGKLAILMRISLAVLRWSLLREGTLADTLAESRRNCTRAFYVQAGSLSARICKQAFLKIHAITNRRLNRALKAVEKNNGSPHQDQRGKHESVNKTPVDKTELVKEHISSFPASSSHYSSGK